MDDGGKKVTFDDCPAGAWGGTRAERACFQTPVTWHARDTPRYWRRAYHYVV